MPPPPSPPSPSPKIFDHNGDVVRYFDNTIQPKRQHAMYSEGVEDNEHVFLDVNGRPLLAASPGDYVPVACLLELTLGDIVEQDPESGSWAIMPWRRVTEVTAKSLEGSMAPQWYK